VAPAPFLDSCNCLSFLVEKREAFLRDSSNVVFTLRSAVVESEAKQDENAKGVTSNMPVPSQLSIAAYSFKSNTNLLQKSFDGLTAEEWLHRPNGSSNHLLWVVGHVLWARGAVLGLLGSPWTSPSAALFARGVKVEDAGKYPAPEELSAALSDSSARLTAALEGASEEELAKPGPEKIPSVDGTVGGVVSFLAFHETTHVGQAAYLRAYLGHPGVMG